MNVDLLRELLLHERYCHGALVDAEKHLTKDKEPEQRARERWQKADDWISYMVSNAILAIAVDGDDAL
jgi:hypothetical protein